jgi:hypothetical protein
VASGCCLIDPLGGAHAARLLLRERLLDHLEHDAPEDLVDLKRKTRRLSSKTRRF